MAQPEGEDFDYRSLVNRWRRERASVALTKMDGHFYEAFDKRLRELRDEYQREHALNPATPKVLILQDELMNLQRIRDDIYDVREEKLMAGAVIAARGGKSDRGNMTKEEDALFDEVLRVLRDARRNLLRRGQPAKEAPKPIGGPPSPPDEPGAPSAAVAQPAAMAQLASPPDSGPEAPLPGAPIPAQARAAPHAEAVSASEESQPKRLGPARVLVRVKEAVPTFVGPDLRQYRLAAEDVAAVPKEVAHALVQRGAASLVGA